MQNTTKERIIFLDIMRAVAVLMMVEGHTVDTLLGDQFRSSDYLFYDIWHAVRGYTAPMFMFISGAVFSYLLNKNKSRFFENKRLVKGIKRFFLLVGLGYLLRYPSHRIIYFSHVSERGWQIFYAVDALHLIGFGILFIVLLRLLADLFKIESRWFYAVSALTILAVTPFIVTAGWLSYLPAPVAAYFTSSGGSYFPLFPWSAYCLAGAFLGNIIANYKDIQKTQRFIRYITIFGFLMLLSSVVFFNSGFEIKPLYHIPLFLQRLGVVLLFSGVVSYMANRLRQTPKIIIAAGRNTLLIYVVHVIVLYGSAWSPGLYKYLAHSFSLSLTAFSALVMITFMIGMVYIKDYIILKKDKKIKVATI